jgi:BlaI family transcriptional regulator, penicillinase repressor
MRKPAPPRDIPPPLELLCLKALWRLEEGNVRDVREELAPSRQLAYTTVMTLLERLARKGTVSRRKVGRAFLYKPAVSKELMRRMALREFLEIHFDGSEELLAEFLRGPDKPKALAAVVQGRPAPVPEPVERLDTALL